MCDHAHDSHVTTLTDLGSVAPADLESAPPLRL